MADEYPWGKEAPQKRVSKLENLLRTNEKKREEFLASVKAKVAEFDETDKTLKADLKAATAIMDRERNRAQIASASRVMEKVFGGASVDLDEVIKSGRFEELLQKLVSDNGSASSGSLSEGNAAPAGDA